MRQLGSRYLLESRVGAGGMGEVWRGVDADGVAHAFKLLLPQYASDPELVKRFVAERHVLTSVQHPNVVGVHDLVIEGSTLAIVMDLVEGTDLRRYLDSVGTLPPAEACRIAGQLAAALEAIHAHRIVHRDVKPANTLLDVTAGMRVRLSDFGVARLADDAQGHQVTIMAGTPLYMAPEVLNGAAPSTQSDLYSLGIVLYEMLIGHAPFAGLAPGPMMQAHLGLDPGRIPGLGEPLWQVVAALLHKDPARRPPGAGAVAARLEYLAGQLVGQPRLAKPAAPPAPVPSPHAVPQAALDLSPPLYRPTTPTHQPTLTPVPGLPADEPRGQGWTSWLAVVVAVLVVALGVLLAMRYLGGASGAPNGSSGATAAASPSPSPSGSSGGPSPSASAAFPPTGAIPCAGQPRLAVNSVTSCEFAVNVATEYRRVGPGDISAYSPTTGIWYDMACAKPEQGIAVCTGGSGAEVYILE